MLTHSQHETRVGADSREAQHLPVDARHLLGATAGCVGCFTALLLDLAADPPRALPHLNTVHTPLQQQATLA